MDGWKEATKNYKIKMLSAIKLTPFPSSLKKNGEHVYKVFLVKRKKLDQILNVET